jgi:YfiH family protein
MITRLGAAFTSAADGDMNLQADRVDVSARLGIDPEWGMLTQVHGSDVVVIDAPGVSSGDGMVTTTPRLPVAVRTADCVGVVLHGPGVVGVAHAGWRGAAAGILERVATVMRSEAAAPIEAVVGPFIGPCCFEVGPEVVAAFPEAPATTTWGTASVDLGVVVRHRLPGLEVSFAGGCTRCGDGWFSHRGDQTARRLAAIGWIP